jgi:hypothetical protein
LIFEQKSFEIWNETWTLIGFESVILGFQSPELDFES